jgi:putative DNA methylase
MMTNWYVSRESTSSTFARQAIQMTWDFAETNPLLEGTGTFANAVEWTADCLLHLPAAGDAIVTQSPAAQADFNGATVSTDPPYYDNIGYSDLSDYFYVWLRRSLRTAYPELFRTVLTPKDEELVANAYRFGGNKREAEEHFETGFGAVFEHVASSAGDTPATVYYAFKQAEDAGTDGGASLAQLVSTGWEKMLQGLLGSGLAVTGTWPVRTEASNRMLSMGTNALASSIVLVCRPRSTDAGVTDRRGFQQALRGRLAGALRDLQTGGVAPVDLAQAAIGPGMAVFSSYAKVVESNGSPMSVRTALALINQVLDEVTAEQEGEFDEDTRWAIAWYAEHGMDYGPFGRADDLSRAKNVSVEGLVRAGIVTAKAGKVRLLDRAELDPGWDPAKDSRLTIWEVTQHLIRRLWDEDEASAADLLRRVGGLGEPARDLAYRLFQIAESKKWSKEAAPYNALAAAWPELSRRAALGTQQQGTFAQS